MKNPLFFILTPFLTVYSLNTFLRHWHCIGIKDKINFSKPFPFKIGELSLVAWKNHSQKNEYSTTWNICKHMGSKLGQAKITTGGCLKCPYHGYEYNRGNPTDIIGKTICQDGKIFWSYDPLTETPPTVPFSKNRHFETSHIEVEMPCSLPDSAYNTMDLLHPEFVHNNAFGFGNSIPPKNIQNYAWNKNGLSHIGMSFDYYSNSFVTRGISHTQNYHQYVYPSFTWSRVSFLKNHLFIGVHFLPTETRKTKWFITLRHNFYKNPIEKPLLKMMATSILTQDYFQMINQSEESEMKKAILFSKTFDNETPVLRLHKLFTENYKFPDLQDSLELYRINSEKDYPPIVP